VRKGSRYWVLDKPACDAPNGSPGVVKTAREREGEAQPQINPRPKREEPSVHPKRSTTLSWTHQEKGKKGRVSAIHLEGDLPFDNAVGPRGGRGGEGGSKVNLRAVLGAIRSKGL